MAIVFSRVDSRMIHGQVAIAWTRLLAVDEILVINDNAAQDETQRMLLELAVPPGVDLIIASIDEAVSCIKNDGLMGTNTMIIYRELHDAVRMLQKGVKTAALNIGGIYHKEGKQQYEKALFLDEQDIRDLKYLAANGVDLFYQVAPMNSKAELGSLVTL